MRADRLISIVLLLQRHRQMKAKDLAEMLDVSERTIYRDIDALALSGVPVYTQTGPDGGCFLDEGYRNSLNWFTGTELQTLLYTGSATPLLDLGMERAMDNALLKLLTLLPDRHKKQTAQMQQRLYLDPSSWYGTDEQNPFLPVLKQAVWTDTVIAVHYETWEGVQKQVTLAPYSLVHKPDRWYLVATTYPDGDMRTYRISRLSGVHLQTIQFERDPNFEIAVYWQEASEKFQQRLPTYPVILRAHTSTDIYFKHTYYGRYEILQEEGDWSRLRVYYTVHEEALTSVLGLGTHVEVIEPKSLHDDVIEEAQKLLNREHNASEE